MYYVVDESKLSSEAGYSVYTAGTATSVPWSGVTEKPSSYPPASHNHDERYYTETEMNSKLDEKATKVHTHTKSEVGLGNVDNTADATKSVKYAISAGAHHLPLLLLLMLDHQLSQYISQVVSQ